MAGTSPAMTPDKWLAGMRANSLALRLFLSATAWTVVILVATGIILSSIYHEAVESSFDRRLSVYLRTLVADVAAPEQSADRGNPTLGEPLFELPLSGWYWQITALDIGKPDVRSSRSLWDTGLPRLRDEDATTSPDGARHGYAVGPEEQRLRLLERTVDLGEDGRYLIVVAGDPQEIDDAVRAFDRALLATFGTLAAVLLVITMFQVRFGLAPLKRISEALAAIRAGTAERLEGRFPVEIAPLARETNALIDANREIVERARTHVGNLAHALKTPLSVVVNEAAGRDDPLAVKVTEQAHIMRDQIARHLERARLAAGLKVVASVTSVVPVVAALTRTMEKIHQGRGIAIDLDAPADVRFRGERQDLEEMVGNLVDNACKWAQMRVSVEVVAERRDGIAAVRIIIDDDGPGLGPAQRDQVARRGRRLDETKPGSGLGLSIVLELATLYGGNLQLGNAPIGGLRAELVLPAV
jgi:signal transduction histidine kinase